ncbi:reverse transcriptase domain-containing protein [Tanacetum coccineum]
MKHQKVLKGFLRMIQRNLQAQVITVRTNRGIEFLNKTLHAYLKEEGIEHQTSTPRTPEQNVTIKVNTASTPITTASINITTAEPVTTASAPITTAGVSVSTTEPSTPLTTTATRNLIEDEDLIIAQTFMKMKSEKSKAKGVTMQEPSESGTRRLQAELDKEAMLEREREEEASKAANIAEWDDVQAMMDANYALAVKL